jgi:hypothetical protein
VKESYGIVQARGDGVARVLAGHCLGLEAWFRNIIMTNSTLRALCGGRLSGLRCHWTPQPFLVSSDADVFMRHRTVTARGNAWFLGRALGKGGHNQEITKLVHFLIYNFDHV